MNKVMSSNLSAIFIHVFGYSFAHPYFLNSKTTGLLRRKFGFFDKWAIFGKESLFLNTFPKKLRELLSFLKCLKMFLNLFKKYN